MSIRRLVALFSFARRARERRLLLLGTSPRRGSPRPRLLHAMLLPAPLLPAALLRCNSRGHRSPAAARVHSAAVLSVDRQFGHDAGRAGDPPAAPPR